jgi:hypothetical protein
MKPPISQTRISINMRTFAPVMTAMTKKISGKSIEKYITRKFLTLSETILFVLE